MISRGYAACHHLRHYQDHSPAYGLSTARFDCLSLISLVNPPIPHNDAAHDHPAHTYTTQAHAVACSLTCQLLPLPADAHDAELGVACVHQRPTLGAAGPTPRLLQLLVNSRLHGEEERVRGQGTTRQWWRHPATSGSGYYRNKGCRSSWQRHKVHTAFNQQLPGRQTGSCQPSGSPLPSHQIPARFPGPHPAPHQKIPARILPPPP